MLCFDTQAADDGDPVAIEEEERAGFGVGELLGDSLNRGEDDGMGWVRGIDDLKVLRIGGWGGERLLLGDEESCLSERLLQVAIAENGCVLEQGVFFALEAERRDLAAVAIPDENGLIADGAKKIVCRADGQFCHGGGANGGWIGHVESGEPAAMVGLDIEQGLAEVVVAQVHGFGSGVGQS